MTFAEWLKDNFPVANTMERAALELAWTRGRAELFKEMHTAAFGPGLPKDLE